LLTGGAFYWYSNPTPARDLRSNLVIGVAGYAAVCLLAVYFFLYLTIDWMGLLGTFSLLTFFGIALVYFAYQTKREWTPVRVGVGTTGIQLELPGGKSKPIAWSDIARVRLDRRRSGDIAFLFDRHGKMMEFILTEDAARADSDAHERLRK